MIIPCIYCNIDINSKGLSNHLLKLHNISFNDYVINNLELFPNRHICQVCGINITSGKSCSRACAAKRQTIRQTGRIGWSKGLTKNDHPGLLSMSIKASNRKGINIWDRMSESTKSVAKQKMSDKAKINNKGENNPMYGKTHTADSIQKIFKYRKATKLEQRLINFLNKHKIDHYFQFFIGKESKYSYDFKIKNKNIIIELDGDYWHGGPSCKKHHFDVKNTQIRDKIKEEYAISSGYKLLRFWESEVINTEQLVFSKILNEIRIR